jgi:hypothetical protein
MLGSSDHNDDALDALAAAALTATSRRQIVKLAGGVAVTGLFSGLMPGRARARSRGGASGAKVRTATKTTGQCPAQPMKPCYGTRDTAVTSTGCKGAGGGVVSIGIPSEYNGCGPQSGLDLLPGVDLTRGDWIPDSPFDLANFFNACKGHDCCYGKCGSDKAKCDSDFHQDMIAACAANWGVPDSLFGDLAESYCYSVADTYYNAVSGTQTGTDAYNAGQDEVCDCCVDCQTAAKLGAMGDPVGECEAQYALTCPDTDNPGAYVCVDGCADGDNCGACGKTCPPKDNGDGSSQRGCCQSGSCNWDPGCLDYCSCWALSGG